MMMADEPPILELLNAGMFKLNVFYEPDDRRYRLVLSQDGEAVLTDWVDAPNGPDTTADMAALKAKSTVMFVRHEKRRNAELMGGG